MQESLENDDVLSYTGLDDFLLQSWKKDHWKKRSLAQVDLYENIFPQMRWNTSMAEDAFSRLRVLFYEETCDKKKLNLLNKMKSFASSDEDHDWMAYKYIPYLDKVKSPVTKLNLYAVLYGSKHKIEFYKKIQEYLWHFFQSSVNFATLCGLLDHYNCQNKTAEIMAGVLLNDLAMVSSKELKLNFLTYFLRRKTLSDYTLEKIKDELLNQLGKKPIETEAQEKEKQEKQEDVSPDSYETISWSDLLKPEKNDVQNMIDELPSSRSLLNIIPRELPYFVPHEIYGKKEKQEDISSDSYETISWGDLLKPEKNTQDKKAKAKKEETLPTTDEAVSWGNLLSDKSGLY